MSVVFFKVLLFCLFVLASYSAIVSTHLFIWRRRCAPRALVPSSVPTPFPYIRAELGHYAPFGAKSMRLVARTGQDALALTPLQAKHFEHAMALVEGKQSIGDRTQALVSDFMISAKGMTEAQFRERYESLIQEWRDKGCPDYY